VFACAFVIGGRGVLRIGGYRGLGVEVGRGDVEVLRVCLSNWLLDSKSWRSLE